MILQQNKTGWQFYLLQMVPGHLAGRRRGHQRHDVAERRHVRYEAR